MWRYRIFFRSSSLSMSARCPCSTPGKSCSKYARSPLRTAAASAPSAGTSSRPSRSLTIIVSSDQMRFAVGMSSVCTFAKVETCGQPSPKPKKASQVRAPRHSSRKCSTCISGRCTKVQFASMASSRTRNMVMCWLPKPSRITPLVLVVLNRQLPREHLVFSYFSPVYAT